MNILLVSAEVSPFAKVGGLADVVGALPIALKRLGVDVRIIMPRYERLTGNPSLEPLLPDVVVTTGRGQEHCRVLTSQLPETKVPVYLIENTTYLSRGPVYNEHGVDEPFTELARFLFFSAAVAEIVPLLGWEPNIVHCHDWHTGLVPALLARRAVRAATVFTIHNLAHQGGWNAAAVLSFLELQEADGRHLATRDRHGDLNLLQQGVLGATLINTVSPHYAQEILTPERGEGLAESLQDRRDDLVGIINGIDTHQYDPAHDRYVRVRYTAATIERKAENKLALHEQCGFTPDPTIPTFGFIGRLTEQKGVDLIVQHSTMMVRSGARLVLLGSGLADYESLVQKLTREHPRHIYARLGFDEAFARAIYAGCDLFLMPSVFEPCGLGQMIAMRYGTPPVVHATGGLIDTVPDVAAEPERGLGFTFTPFTPKAFAESVARGLHWYHDRPRWQALLSRCMTQDFSWDRSARAYLELYQQARKTL
ncbi:MAG: glycogen synthase [Candidatus Kerfeldbacteria bacterium]|nr:glycogen synthase [Candidatus Kerfeldbacteria bacterium]